MCYKLISKFIRVCLHYTPHQQKTKQNENLNVRNKLSKKNFEWNQRTRRKTKMKSKKKNYYEKVSTVLIIHLADNLQLQNVC